MVAVSIVIPAYNMENYIERAISSALGQSLANLEVLVVDDASQDATAAIVERLAAADARVRLIRLAVNGGLSVARNAAIDEARGEWIAILDADDWYAPERLEKLLELGRAGDADLVADNLSYVMEGYLAPWQTLFPRRGPSTFTLTVEDIVRGSGAGYPKTVVSIKPMFRRAFLERHGIRYRDVMRAGEDGDILLRCLSRTPKVAMLREPLYHYLVRRSSLSHTMADDRIQMIKRYNEELIELYREAPQAQLWLRRRGDRIERYLRMKEILGSLSGLRLGRALAALARDPGILPHLAVYVGYGLGYRLKRRLVLACLPKATGPDGPPAVGAKG